MFEDFLYNKLKEIADCSLEEWNGFYGYLLKLETENL